MMIKTIAKGFILNKYSYLRNPWNWLDFIVVVAGYITLSLQAIGVAIGNLSGLRTFRVLRALKTVSITPGLKTIVNAMLHSLGMLAEVMTLTVFCLMVFALLALQLYVGLLRQKCVLDVPLQNISHESYAIHVNNRSMWLLDGDGQPAVCGNKTGARKCPQNYSCLPGIGENPNFGYTNFDSYGWALLTTFQLITLDYWEDVYNKEKDKIKRFTSNFPNRLYSTLIALKAQTRMFRPTFRRRSRQPQRWCSPRRGAGMPSALRAAPSRISTPRSEVVGSTNNTLHSPVRTFAPGETLYEEEEEEDDQRVHLPKKPMCLREAPDIVISTGGQLPVIGRVMRSHRFTRKTSVHPFNTLQRPPSEQSLRVTWCRIHFGYCYRRGGRMLQAALRFVSRLRRYLAVIVSDPLFDMMITVCILLNTAFLSVEHYGMTAKTERILRFGNLVFTIIFSLEAAVKLVALGRDYFRSKWNLFDFVVVVVSLADLSFETVGGLSVLRTF
ncbi:Sodium channel protein 60E, partial [Stegodyphus mimosarum]